MAERTSATNPAPERAQASAGERCEACPSAAASAGAGLLRCECGTWHGAPDARWPRSRETPEPTTGVRVRPGLDAPVGTIAPPRAKPARIERGNEEEARRARLLAQLRPHGPGPWEPLDGPAEGKGASLAPRTTARAPWDVDAPRGAFVRDVPGDAASEVVRHIDRAAGLSLRGGAGLAWLRRSGTLANGCAAMDVGLALALADEERRTSWEADEAHGYDRMRVWGAARFDEACAAWEATR